MATGCCAVLQEFTRQHSLSSTNAEQTAACLLLSRLPAVHRSLPSAGFCRKAAGPEHSWRALEQDETTPDNQAKGYLQVLEPQLAQNQLQYIAFKLCQADCHLGKMRLLERLLLQLL